MSTELLERSPAPSRRASTWLAAVEPPRFDLAERRLDEAVEAERDARARAELLERAARERALFQLD